MSEFRGFAPELFTFFEGLAKDNSKSFWNAHRAEWEQYVRDPMRALLEDLAGEFGPLRMFRPNRDMRFSKDKSPYKLWVGATSEVLRCRRHRLLHRGVRDPPRHRLRRDGHGT